MKLTLSRRYSFAASHRLSRPDWSAERNRQVYGKCANPYGHGHNYVVEVTVAGRVDPSSGMIANLAELDGFVQREVLEPFDHTFLNEQIPELRDPVPTTENLCREIFRRLRAFPGARLERVRMEETSKNSFEYGGENEAVHPGAQSR